MLCLRPFSEVAPEELRALEHRMAQFYRNPPPAYYMIADGAVGRYTAEELPLHFDLVSRIRPGDRVVEVGCGTAHLCPAVEERGADYTGMEYNPELLAENRRRYPRARFLPVSEEPTELFDFVASLYTIEHVAEPPAYLERMWTLCRPGGLIAIICPEFIDNNLNPPSLTYGTTPRRLREKLGTFCVFDATRHVVDLVWSAPRWRRYAQAAPPGAFWMNLCPRALNADYEIDTDAIHLSRLRDLTHWLVGRGASILATSRTLSGIPAEVLRFNCYVVARKPANTLSRQ